VKKNVDPLTEWLVKSVRQINPNVDSEVFATFLLGIESPNEIEDYIFSYFGETKAAKQFHQEFLSKRIELRPRRGAKKEDVSDRILNPNFHLFRTCLDRPKPRALALFRVVQVQKEAKNRRRAKTWMCRRLAII
jgi:PERQ amino acid-rich with GYF domain-containing protein